MLTTLGLAAGCRRSPPPAAGLVPAAASEAAPDDVRPVYPLDGAPHPLAEKLCAALHGLPAERRATCCHSAVPTVVTSECVRMLSASLRAGALSLDEAALPACLEAVAAAHAGCDWVGPLPPPLPAACQQLFTGNLPARARCRSSLECAQRRPCLGAGPTEPGRCGAPRGDGGACALSVDALAAYVRIDADRIHPECDGRCDRHRCVPAVGPRGPCSADVQCAAGLHCDGRRCSEGLAAGVGEACTSACEGGARCLAGRCRLPAAAGEPCGSDLDCRGACLRSANGSRRCGLGCEQR